MVKTKGVECPDNSYRKDDGHVCMQHLKDAYDGDRNCPSGHNYLKAATGEMDAGKIPTACFRKAVNDLCEDYETELTDEKSLIDGKMCVVYATTEQDREKCGET